MCQKALTNQKNPQPTQYNSLPGSIIKCHSQPFITYTGETQEYGKFQAAIEKFYKAESAVSFNVSKAILIYCQLATCGSPEKLQPVSFQLPLIWRHNWESSWPEW